MISWNQFILAILALTSVYYVVIVLRYYQKELRQLLTGKVEKNAQTILLIAMSVVISQLAMGQTADGNNGINQANTLVRSYFDAGTQLMYAVGALVGLVGAIKVYDKWIHGHPDTGKTAAAWFGSCIFLVLVATVIKSFFGM